MSTAMSEEPEMPADVPQQAGESPTAAAAAAATPPVYHGYENLFAEFGLLEDQEQLFRELPRPPGASDTPSLYHLVQDQPGATWLLSDNPDIMVNPFLKNVRQHSQVGHLVTFEAPLRPHLRPLAEYREVLDFGLRTGPLGLLSRCEELIRQAERQS